MRSENLKQEDLHIVLNANRLIVTFRILPLLGIIISFEEFQNENSAVGTIHDLILNGKYRPYMIVRSSIEMFNARTNMTQKISSSSKMCKGTV